MIKKTIKALFLHFSAQKNFIQLILLSFWAIFQYVQGNKLYAVFIVLFFIVLVISRSSNFTIISASVLIIIMFKSPILETWVEIKQINLETFQPLRTSLNKLFAPNSGREALPNDVQQMLILIQENNLPSYRLSASFQNDELIKQRIVESAWPVKNEQSSKYLLSPVDEAEDIPACNEFDRTENVVLVHCP